MIQLMTITDVADELGVSRSRARALAHWPTFPAPHGVTPRGWRVWLAADVAAFAVSEQWTHRRGPGRPRAPVGSGPD